MDTDLVPCQEQRRMEMATLEETTILKRKVMETYVVATTMTKKKKIPCQKHWRMKMAT